MFNWFKKKREEEKGEPKNLQLISLCLAFEVAASDNDIVDLTPTDMKIH